MSNKVSTTGETAQKPSMNGLTLGIFESRPDAEDESALKFHPQTKSYKFVTKLNEKYHMKELLSYAWLHVRVLCFSDSLKLIIILSSKIKKPHYMKVLLNSFGLNGYTLGVYPELRVRTIFCSKINSITWKYCLTAFTWSHTRVWCFINSLKLRIILNSKINWTTWKK